MKRHWQIRKPLLGGLLFASLLGACSGMAFYEGMRTQQQQTRDANRNSPDPLPPFDQYKKERDSMRPTGQ